MIDPTKPTKRRLMTSEECEQYGVPLGTEGPIDAGPDYEPGYLPSTKERADEWRMKKLRQGTVGDGTWAVMDWAADKIDELKRENAQLKEQLYEREFDGSAKS